MALEFHRDSDENNKHTPKGFTAALNNSYAVKSEKGLSVYDKRNVLPAAINFVDGNAAPPTSASGDIYVLIDLGNGTVDAGWGGASYNDWVRSDGAAYFNITPLVGDLCNSAAGDWYKFDGAAWVLFGVGATDTNIANSNLSLDAVRTTDMNGFNLTITNGGAAATLGIHNETIDFGTAGSGLRLLAAGGAFQMASTSRLGANEFFVLHTPTGQTTFSHATAQGFRIIEDVGGTNHFILQNNLFGFAPNTDPNSKVYVLGQGNDNTSRNLYLRSAGLNDLLEVKNGGEIVIGQTPATDNTNNNILVRDGVTGAIELRDASTIGGAGVVGISDANGVYTYYATLQAAITAASAGDTVELFADIVETGAVEIILKDGVNINGNGHTYTLNNNGNLYTVKDNNIACEVKISDFHFKRIGTVLTADENLNYILEIQSTSSKIDVTGCSFISSNLPACLNNGTLIGGYFKGNGTKFALAYSLQNSGFVYNGVFESDTALLVSQQATINNSGTLHNCRITSVDVRSITNNGEAYNCTGKATAVGVVSLYNDGGKLFNCSAKADGVAISIVNGGKADGCNGYSTGSFGINVGTNAELRNSTGYSSANNGIEASTTTSKLYNCVGRSDALHGINIFGYALNCTGYSTGGNGIASFVNCNVYNSTGISTAAVGGSNGSNWYNCTFESSLNTTSGHAYISSVAGISLIGCTFKVANAGAFCITNGTRATNYSNSNFIGATTPVNPTTPQGIVNAHDNQGNILI